MPPSMISYIHEHPYITIFLFLIVFIFIGCIAYILFDIFNKFKNKFNLYRCKNLQFKCYKLIKENPKSYDFYASYGLENSLIIFNTEAPYLIDVIETCIDRNRHLLVRYNNHEDPNILSSFLDIEIKLTSIIATSGINLIKRCDFYCDNLSKSFKVKCDNNIIQNYIIISDKLHDQFKKLEQEEFKSPEVMEISKTMYQEFFNYFNKINSLVYMHYNKKNNKEENHND